MFEFLITWLRGGNLSKIPKNFTCEKQIFDGFAVKSDDDGGEGTRALVSCERGLVALIFRGIEAVAFVSALTEVITPRPMDCFVGKHDEYATAAVKVPSFILSTAAVASSSSLWC
jgi:hypothetical protein